MSLDAGSGFNLGNALGFVDIDTEGISKSMDSARDGFKKGIEGMASSLDSIGESISGIGQSMTVLSAGLTAGFVGAGKVAMDFEESMANVRSITGQTADEIDMLGDTLNDMASTTRFGSNEVADGFYTIVSSVQDASTHMDILEQSMALAQAGNVSLESAISGVTSVMNAYSLEAEDAAMVSDVITRTVQMGVGTMDEFAGALGPLAGLAFDVGVGFDELAGATAFLTSTGSSASEATTQLQAIMTAFLNPNTKMKEALEALGAESGRSLIQMHGLAGAVQLVAEQSGGLDGELAGTLGSVEALNGAIGLMSERSEGFLDNFVNSIDGATAAAEAAQMESAAAQFDLLKSAVEALAVDIGKELLPAFADIVSQITPIIQQIRDWVQNNPQLVRAIAAVSIGATVLGGSLMGIGFAMQQVAPLISGAGKALLFLTSPIGLIVGAVTALGIAWTTNFMGIRDSLEPVVRRITDGFRMAMSAISDFRSHLESTGSFITAISITMSRAISSFLLGLGVIDLKGFERLRFNLLFWFHTMLTDVQIFAMRLKEPLQDGLDVAADVFGGMVRIISRVAGDIRDGLELVFTGDFKGGMFGGAAEDSPIVDFFLDIRETIQRVVDAVKPLLSELGRFFGRLFETIDFRQILDIGLTLLSLTNPLGILTTGLKFFGVDIIGVFETVMDALTIFLGTINDGGNVFDGLRAVFGETSFIDGLETAFDDIVSFITTTLIPGLDKIRAWFLEEALPGVLDFVQNTVLPGIQDFFDFLSEAWTYVGPALQRFGDWFMNDVLPQLIDFVQNTVLPAVQDFFGFLSEAWDIVGPALAKLAIWFLEDALPRIQTFISETVIPAINDFVNKLREIWDKVSPFLLKLLNWFINEGLPAIIDFIENTVVPAVDDFVETLKGIWEDVEPVLQKLYTWFVEEALPAIIDFIENTAAPAFEKFIDWLSGIWDKVQPGLEKLFDFLSTTLFPIFQDILEGIVIPAIQKLIDIVGGIWDLLSTPLNNVLGLFEDIFGKIVDTIFQVVNWLTGTPEGQMAFTMAIDFVKSTIGEPLESIKGFFDDAFGKIGQIVDDIRTKIEEFVGWVEGAIDKVKGAVDGVGAEFDRVVSDPLGSIGGDANPFREGSGIFRGIGDFLNIGRRASGGPVDAMTPYIVGEEGPELFIADMAGAIIPNDMLNFAGTSTGEMLDTVSFVNASGADSAFTPVAGGNTDNSNTTFAPQISIEQHFEGGLPDDDIARKAYDAAYQAMLDVMDELQAESRNISRNR